jgi:DNA-binding transcriptional LysR family regulator
MLHETDLSRVDLNLLILFEAIMRERHVGRAAQQLNLSPSAVSHGLDRLRRMLNDALFIKHPKGMNPTARAVELAGPIEEALARVRAVVEAAHPFAPERSQRRFLIGMPDAVAAVVASPLLRAIGREAPGVDLGVLTWMPQDQWDALDRRDVDLIIGPVDEIPARFESLALYDETFVVVGAAGHPWFQDPTLDGYCAARHVLVSATGDPFGLVDRHLAALGLRRRVALTAPSFVFALAAVASTDLLAALPGAMVARFAPALGLGVSPTPVEIELSLIAAVVPRSALRDPGVAWLMALIEREVRPELRALSRVR